MAAVSSQGSAKEVAAASSLLTLVSFAAVIGALYLGRTVLMPMALAVLFAFLLNPIVDLLERAHLGRIGSVLISLVLSFVLFFAVGWGVTNQLLEILGHLPDYQENIHEKIGALSASGFGGLRKATASMNDLSKELSAASDSAKKQAVGRNREPIAVQVAAPPRNASEYLRAVVGPVSGILETAGIVVVFTLFILLQQNDLRNRLLRLAGISQLNNMTQALAEASRRLARYLLMQLLVNVGYGLLFGLGLYLIGIPHPFIWAVFAICLRFIPYIGTAIAALLPMTVALAIFPGWKELAATLVLFLILEIAIANLVEPWLYGSHTGLSALAVLVAAIFWGMLWGPVGLILSTPLTMCLLVFGRYIPQLAFVEILFGDEPVLSPPAHFYQRLLAMDDEEARDILQRYLKDNSIENLYDSVLIPALSLAETDRHKDILDETRTNFIHQSARELIQEFAEASYKVENGELAQIGPPALSHRIACVPAKDEADAIIGTMAAHLLRRSGYNAVAVPLAQTSEMLDHVAGIQADTICVSALPPLAAPHAKALCRQLRERFPQSRIILGLWEYPGGMERAQQRVGVGCADAITTSLAQILSMMNDSTHAEAAALQSPEPALSVQHS
jgi:predicted PurR-regulated permease PerM